MFSGDWQVFTERNPRREPTFSLSLFLPARSQSGRTSRLPFSSSRHTTRSMLRRVSFGESPRSVLSHIGSFSARIDASFSRCSQQNWEMEPVFHAAKNVLASEELGKLTTFEWNAASRTEAGSRWHATSWRTVRACLSFLSRSEGLAD